jgi:hypothetical protein
MTARILTLPTDKPLATHDGRQALRIALDRLTWRRLKARAGEWCLPEADVAEILIAQALDPRRQK